MTGELRQLRTFADIGKREKLGRVVAKLSLKCGKVDTAAIQARGGAGFHSTHAQAQLLEVAGQSKRGWIAQTPGGKLFEADMDQAVKKSAGGDDHRRSVQFFPQRGFYSANPTMIKKQAVGGGLANLQIFLVFQHRFHPQAIAQAVSLGSR